jgi:hypothetical protein
MRTGGRPLACRQSFWRFSATSRGTGLRSDEPEPAADRVAAALLVEWPAPQAPAGVAVAAGAAAEVDLAAAEVDLAAAEDLAAAIDAGFFALCAGDSVRLMLRASYVAKWF